MYAFLPFPHSRTLICIRDVLIVHDGVSLAPTSYLALPHCRGRQSPPWLCDVCYTYLALYATLTTADVF